MPRVTRNENCSVNLQLVVVLSFHGSSCSTSVRSVFNTNVQFTFKCEKLFQLVKYREKKLHQIYKNIFVFFNFLFSYLQGKFVINLRSFKFNYSSKLQLQLKKKEVILKKSIHSGEIFNQVKIFFNMLLHFRRKSSTRLARAALKITVVFDIRQILWKQARYFF